MQDTCSALSTQAVDKAASQSDLRRMGRVAEGGAEGLSIAECRVRIDDAVQASAMARKFYGELVDEIELAKGILEKGLKDYVRDPDLERLLQEEDDVNAVGDDEERTEVEGGDAEEGMKREGDVKLEPDSE